MKTKSIFKTTLAVISLSLITACGEDFLEVQPSEFLSESQIEEAAENNPDVLAGSLAGIYSLTFDDGTGGTSGHDDFGQKGFDLYADLLSSDMALSTSTYGWYRDATEYQVTQDFTFTENYMPWRYYYRIIRSANLVIDGLGGSDVTPVLDENKWVMGQAKAMRAHSYFYLTQYYADEYNPTQDILPLYTTGGEVNGPKVSTQVIYDLMISDLTEAVDLLSTFSRSAKNQVNQDIAKGILAYVYGITGDFAEMKQLTGEVITSGAYPLVDGTQATGGFNDVNTPGWMWGVDITLDHDLDLISWWGQMDLFTYSYAWAGDRKTIDLDLFNSIPANDVRKTQFLDVPSHDYYLMPINKFYHVDQIIGGQRNIESDYIYMRVAEMYLLNAEASARTGDEPNARLMLKALLDLRIPDSSYVDALSGLALLDEIHLQTRIELWGEGKSYLALKRFKGSTTRGATHLSGVGETVQHNDDRLTFEIPESEIQNNPFISTQN